MSRNVKPVDDRYRRVRQVERVLGAFFYLAFLVVIAKLSWLHANSVLLVLGGIAGVALVGLFIWLFLRRVRAQPGHAERDSGWVAHFQRIALYLVGIIIASLLFMDIAPPAEATSIAIVLAAGLPLLLGMLKKPRGLGP